jgi:hypothetical protein
MDMFSKNRCIISMGKALGNFNDFKFNRILRLTIPIFSNKKKRINKISKL